MRGRRVIASSAIALLVIAIWLLFTSPHPKILRVSTTTSLYATGLLDALADDFERDHPKIVVQFIAVGSGEALRRAEMGDADLVLVHAPSWEKEYIEKGVIGERRIFAYNFFVILGPRDDPAGIDGVEPVEAMRLIFEAGERGETRFVSRGDNSGTHIRELSLWEDAGLNPRGRPWYVETGSGMAEALMIANEMSAYTLSDIGTYLKFGDRLGALEPFVERGVLLVNIYSAYIVTGSESRGLAEEFVQYLTSKRAQELIGSFGLADFGLPLFNPSLDKLDELERLWSWLAGG